MAEEEPKKVELETPSVPPHAPTPALEPVKALKDVTEEKSAIPASLRPADVSKALAVVESKVPESVEGKVAVGSVNRDAVLARVETEKRISLIKAWEESEKCTAENKAHKKISSIEAWENGKTAAVEAELKQIEAKLENKKAEYVEKMKNKIALIHKEAEEKRAMIEAKRIEDLLKADEIAAKYRATGTVPKKIIGCF